MITIKAAFTDKFQSTSPVRGTTCLGNCFLRISLFQSTSPVRGTTPLPPFFMYS